MDHHHQLHEHHDEKCDNEHHHIHNTHHDEKCDNEHHHHHHQHQHNTHNEDLHHRFEKCDNEHHHGHKHEHLESAGTTNNSLIANIHIIINILKELIQQEHHLKNENILIEHLQ